MISYKYDEIGELTREDNQVLDKTIIYSYDAGGNITEKTEYPYTTGTPENALKTYSYDYNDSNWKDKLTSFDGKEITYDEIGNPLTYDGYTYTWEAGRQLSGISGNGKNITYKYNDSGIRTEKSVDGVTTKYYLDGNKVIYEDNGTDKIYYTYDSLDKLVSMNLNGVEYYYVRNGQGDIISLIDKTGAEVTSYTYDSWGKLISIDGTLKDTVGYKNPYRYRGYRYDTETGLYYLQSRYYNPEIGRFINADDTSILQVTQMQPLGTNLFTYGNNNPVMNSDPTGCIVITNVISAVIGALTSFLMDILGQALVHFLKHNFSLRGFKINWWSAGFAFAGGLITGALLVSNLKRNAQAGVGAMIGFVQGYVVEFATAKQQRRRFDSLQPLIGCIAGFLGGYIGGNGLGRTYLRGKGLWTHGYYIIAGKRYNQFPMKMILSKGFAASFAKYIGGNIISWVSKGL